LEGHGGGTSGDTLKEKSEKPCKIKGCRERDVGRHLKF
jgi:hypothetical protein